MRLILMFVLFPFPPPSPQPRVMVLRPVQAVPLSAPRPAVDRRVLAMGTELMLHLEGAGDLGRASEAALAESGRVEAACSTWNPASAWSRLNAAQGAPVPLAPEWIELLDQAKAWSLRTAGAFDPVLMALVRAWNLRQGGVAPGLEALAAARRASGRDLLELDARSGTARLLHPMAGIEEGAFLKGHALDAMRKASGVPSGWMDFGGQILAWGRPLRASIADPMDRRRSRLSLLLKDASLASSGTSERGRHILDPRSGEPCAAWGAAAVVATDPFIADVLSTALYVMGPDTGVSWAESRGVAAAFLFNDGRVRMTRAFQSLNPTLHPQESP